MAIRYPLAMFTSAILQVEMQFSIWYNDIIHWSKLGGTGGCLSTQASPVLVIQFVQIWWV